MSNLNIKPLIAGNWKMNGLVASTAELKAMIVDLAPRKDELDFLICPPATLIHNFAHDIKGTNLQIGGQDCHFNENGAHTGDISAHMLRDSGATYVIVGHSERRADHGETNEHVNRKVKAAWSAGLMTIICVGETDAERIAGTTLGIVEKQLAGSVPQGATAASTVIAYEPVWAIGTGKTPTVEDVKTVHYAIRKQLIDSFGKEGETMRLLYGGSVKPSNAAEFLNAENVNGALIGGASLKASDFVAIAGTVKRAGSVQLI